MNKLYFKLGLLFSLVSISVGIYELITGLISKDGDAANIFIKAVFYILLGIFVTVVTFLSIKRAKMRYFSQQFQTAILYLIGSYEIYSNGQFFGVIMILTGIMLAYRYSFLKIAMVVFTAFWNIFLLMLFTLRNDNSLISGIQRILFVFLIYVVFYLIFEDYNARISRKIGRLNKELSIARQITPFGSGLKKRIENENLGSVDFTKKEYELMVSMCFYEKVTNEEMSDFMNISIATVKSHLNNIYKKTGIHSRSRLIAAYKNVFVDSVE